MKLVWGTDLHLDSADELETRVFCDEVNDANADALALSGDLAIAKMLPEKLTLLRERISIPIFFVLGNHDYYGSSIAELRLEMGEFCEEFSDLHWLNRHDFFQLGRKSAIVGHDGWADGRFGDFLNSPVELTDYWTIRELMHLSSEERFAKLNELGDRSADLLEAKLRAALVHGVEHVFCVTHVPPFLESCTHKGQIANDDFAPHSSPGPSSKLRLQGAITASSRLSSRLRCSTYIKYACAALLRLKPRPRCPCPFRSLF